MQKEIKRINNMSFNELRDELTYCDNNIKELLIRKLMKDRYLRHIKKKELINKKKEKERIKNQIYTNTIITDDNNKIIEDIDDLFNDDELNKKDYNDDDLIDKKFNKQIERDAMNNNLMNRMNSELEIRNNKKNKNKDKNILPPYDFTSQSYTHNNVIPPTDFTSKRLLKDNYNSMFY